MNFIKKIIFLLFKPKKWFNKYGKNNDIGFFNWFQNPKNISIGDHNFMYYGNMLLAGNHKITIGNGCHFAMNILLITYSHAFNLDDIETIPYDRRLTGADIVINDGVWIGTKVTILGGTTIGKGAVLAAGAVVTKNVPDFEVWGGNPAKKISIRKNIERFEMLHSEGKYRRTLEQ